MMLLGAMAAAELASVVLSLALSLFPFWGGNVADVVGIAMVVPPITVLPCILVFIIVYRFWTPVAAWLALPHSLMILVVWFVVAALTANEKPEIAWYFAGTTFVAGVAACATLMWMTCSQVRGRAQTGIRSDQP